MLYPSINSNTQCGADAVLGEVLKTSRTFVRENTRTFLVYRGASVLALSGASDVIYLQDHLDNLSSKQDLLLFANQGLDHMLLFHVCAGEEEKNLALTWKSMTSVTVVLHHTEAMFSLTESTPLHH